MSRQRPDRSRRADREQAAAGRDRAERAAAAQAAREAREAQRRFELASAADPAAGADADDGGVLQRLRDEAIVGMGRVVYSSNAVFLLEFDGPDPHHPSDPLRGIYKPARGERPLWDFPRHTLHLREVASYLVSAALGDRLVPPTTLRDGPYGPGSVQLFIHSAADGDREGGSLTDQVAALAALDVLINNADRKRVHLLVGDDGNLRGIDNALSFLPYPRQRTVLIDLGGHPLPTLVAAQVGALAADREGRASLLTRLSKLLNRAEVEAFDMRLDSLAESRRYPLLDPWDGRPFEWW